MRIALEVLSRDGCPHRRYPDPEGGWGPQVPTCEHPDRRARRGDAWCPNDINQRADDPAPHLVDFPPRCPLRDGEIVTVGVR